MNMNNKYLTILPAVAVLLLAACSNDDMDGPDNTDGLLADGPVPAQVTADISNGQTVTRISTDGDAASFATDDVIHVVADGSEAYEYARQSDGSWSAVSSPYYFQNRSNVSFRGWYADPVAAATETRNSISINTAGQTINDNGWNLWDILATPEVSASALSSTVKFTDDHAFCHIMSQMTLTIKTGDGISDLSALTGYTLKNLTTEASFNTLSCTLTAENSTGEFVQTVSGVSGSEYSFSPIILVPQDITDNKPILDVTYNGQTYSAELSLPNNALAEGTHYMLNMTISNTGVTEISAEIKEWAAPDTQESGASLKDYAYTEDADGRRSYIVYNEAGLQAWGEYTRSGYWDTNCTLAEDIFMSSVASGESNWTAVGTSSSESYAGSFDGNGKTITGLTINASRNYQGLIGFLDSDGEVKNLTMADVNITSTNNCVGAVVGWSYGTVTNSCSVSGSVRGKQFIGGVMGYNHGTVTACYSTVTVTNNVGYGYAGGVVGCSDGTITACYSSGTITGNGYDTGGVVGSISSGSVTACYYSSTTSDSYATYVDGSVAAWADAASTMNSYLTDWKYVANAAYDGTDTTIAPLLLEAVTE